MVPPATSTGATSPGQPGRPGLQSRNVDRNRTEVGAVALALFAERGFDAVTIDDIAEAAGISRRTFFRYFGSKEDALTADEAVMLAELHRLLAGRPADEPIATTIRRAAIALLGPAAADPDVPTRLRLARDTPSVHAHCLMMRSRWELTVRDILAEHLGVEPATSLTATVLATTTVAAAWAAVDVWFDRGCTGDLIELIDEAFDLVAPGHPLAG